MTRSNFIDALYRRNIGTTIIGTGTSIACIELMKHASSYFPEAHLDSEKMAALAETGHTVLGFDVVMPLFSVCHETEALGCKVDWGQMDSMPHSGTPIFKDPEEIKIPPDLINRPSCRIPIKAISLLKKRLGDSAAVCGKVFGSWTLGYHLFGIEQFLIETIENPSKVKQIIERLMPAAIAFANAQIDAGADCILLGDHATADLCSPAAYKKFLQEVHSRLAEEIKAPVILHICGNTRDRIGMISQTKLNCFHWDTKSGPPEEMRQLAGERLALMGGVSNTLLLNGSPDDIFKQAKAAAKAGIDIIGPECAIPLTTPLVNLKTIAAIRQGSK